MGEAVAENIPSNLRLLLILEAISKAGTPVTPTDINKNMGLPKPSIHRLFATLEAEGFIERDIDGRHYAPARRSRVMAVSLISSERLRTARAVILSRVAGEIGETCNIALPDRDTMFYLDREETKWPLRIQLPVGTRVPLYCTASGKMYLSTLPEKVLAGYVRNATLTPRTQNSITRVSTLLEEIANIRARGYAADNQEFMAEMVAIAVPILNDEGRLIATLSTHGPKQRISLEHDISSILTALNQGARELAKLIFE